MSKNASVALGDHFSAFVDQQIADGRYGMPARSSVPDCASWKSTKRNTRPCRQPSRKVSTAVLPKRST